PHSSSISPRENAIPRTTSKGQPATQSPPPSPSSSSAPVWRPVPTTSRATSTPPPSSSPSSSRASSTTNLPAAANSPYVLRTPQGRIRTIRKTTTVTKTTTATSTETQTQTQTSTSTVTAACTTPPAPEPTSSPDPPTEEGGDEGGGTYLRCDTLVTFSLCDSNSCTPMGSVAPGTQCKDGAIVLATAQRLIKVRRGAVVGVPLRGGNGNSTVKLTERSSIHHEPRRHS
ncbi:hypothetical protein JCM5353_002991, partial [Sporobolomyces roseus]